jgi:hypothetical protein
MRTLRLISTTSRPNISRDRSFKQQGINAISVLIEVQAGMLELVGIILRTDMSGERANCSVESRSFPLWPTDGAKLLPSPVRSPVPAVIGSEFYIAQKGGVGLTLFDALNETSSVVGVK